MSLDAFYTFVRFIHFIAAMLACGMSIFAVMLSDGRFGYLLSRYLNKGILFSAAMTAITTFSWMLAQVGLMGDGWRDTIDWQVWLDVFGTSFGQIWRWELLCALLLLIVLFIRNFNTRAYLVLILSVAILGLHALVGHAAMHDGLLGLFHRINQFIHLISAAYWFGGLWPFLICIQFLRNKKELIDGMDKQIFNTMIRFSRIGHIAVGLVLITGGVNAWVLLPQWPWVYSYSEYQSWLWLKVALVGGMVLLALVNRYWVVPNLKLKGRINYLIINSWVELLLGSMAILSVAIFATYQPI